MKKKEKIELNNVTIVAMTSVNVRATIKAMQYSMQGIKFADAVLITDKKPFLLPKTIKYKHIDKIDNIDKFNYSMVYDLYKYIETDFALVVHYDGFVVNPQMWSENFLKYDYIGSPWPLPAPNDKVTFRDINGNICRVGNSVSIRSYRLMELPSKIGMEWNAFHGWYNEDGFICCNNKHIFEQYGMKFAPLEVAIRFGQEAMLPEGKGIKSFVFHKWAGENSKYPNFLPIHVKIKQKFYNIAHLVKNSIQRGEHE